MLMWSVVFLLLSVFTFVCDVVCDGWKISFGSLTCETLRKAVFNPQLVRFGLEGLEIPNKFFCSIPSIPPPQSHYPIGLEIRCSLPHSPVGIEGN